MVISIKPHYMSIVYALYPDYSIVKEIQQPDKFIAIKDVRSQSELYKLELYTDSVIVSNILFTEKWDEAVICEKILEFRRKNFKSRKKTLTEISSMKDEEFLEAALTFLTTGDLPVEDDDIMEVLLSVGTLSFVEKYLQAIEKYPERKLQATVLTFLTKVRAGASESVFYKKKERQLSPAIEKNLELALSGYANSVKDSMSFINFIVMLTT